MDLPISKRIALLTVPHEVVWIKRSVCH